MIQQNDDFLKLMNTALVSEDCFAWKGLDTHPPFEVRNFDWAQPHLGYVRASIGVELRAIFGTRKCIYNILKHIIYIVMFVHIPSNAECEIY